MLEPRRDVSRELDIDRVCRDARDDKRYNGFPACPGRIGGEGGHKLGEEESFSLARRWIRGKFSARDRRNSIVEDGAAGKQRRVKFLSGWILAGGRIGRSNDSRKVFYLPGLRLTSDPPPRPPRIPGSEGSPSKSDAESFPRFDSHDCTYTNNRVPFLPRETSRERHLKILQWRRRSEIEGPRSKILFALGVRAQLSIRFSNGYVSSSVREKNENAKDSFSSFFILGRAIHGKISNRVE